MSKYSLFISFLFFCCTIKSQTTEIDINNIRGIEISYTGALFDANWTRQDYTCPDTKHPRAIIESKNDIDYFCSLLDSLDYRSTTLNNQYGGYSNFFSLGNLCLGIWPQEEVFGFAKIFYRNGRLPELIWLGWRVAIAGKSYDIPISVMEKLYDFVMSKTEENNTSDIISEWQAEPIDCSSISAIDVWTLPMGVELSRSEFAANTKDRTVGFNKILYTEPDKISDIMNAINTLEFKRCLPYDSYSSARQSHIANNGELIWDDISEPVIALIVIHRADERRPELIWITHDGVDRGFFNYSRSEILNSILLGRPIR